MDGLPSDREKKRKKVCSLCCCYYTTVATATPSTSRHDSWRIIFLPNEDPKVLIEEEKRREREGIDGSQRAPFSFFLLIAKERRRAIKWKKKEKPSSSLASRSSEQLAKQSRSGGNTIHNRPIGKDLERTHCCWPRAPSHHSQVVSSCFNRLLLSA